MLWNNLPKSLRYAASAEHFKRNKVAVYRIPKRQSRKAVVLNLSLTDDLPCLNKDLHTHIHP